MREDEILSRLRDIHLPDELGTDVHAVLAWWPFAVLAGLIVLIIILRLVARNRWRRAARGELAAIMEVDDPGRQWAMLLGFASSFSERAGRALTLPEVAFRRPENVGEAERAEFASYLKAELAR